MKKLLTTMIASAMITVSGAAMAASVDYTFSDYPEWAKTAFIGE